MLWPDVHTARCERGDDHAEREPGGAGSAAAHHGGARSMVVLLVAGLAISLAVVAAAGIFSAAGRQVELGVLTIRGWSPFAFGAKAGLETMLPAALGGLAGWASASMLVSSVGPDAPVSAGTRSTAAVAALAGVVGSVAIVAVVSGAAFVARHEHRHRVTKVLAAIPWGARGLRRRLGACRGTGTRRSDGRRRRGAPGACRLPVPARTRAGRGHPVCSGGAVAAAGRLARRWVRGERGLARGSAAAGRTGTDVALPRRRHPHAVGGGGGARHRRVPAVDGRRGPESSSAATCRCGSRAMRSPTRNTRIRRSALPGSGRDRSTEARRGTTCS